MPVFSAKDIIYTFRSHILFAEMPEFLDWMEENGVRKRLGLEETLYRLEYGTNIGWINLTKSAQELRLMPIKVEIFDQAFAAAFRLRWVDEEAK